MHLHGHTWRNWFSRPRLDLARRRAASPAVCLGLSLGLGLGLGATGCGLFTKESSGAADAIKRPELLCARAGADRVEESRFRPEGKNDIAKIFMRSTEAGGGVVLSCKELDLNGDGRKDMLVYYDSRGRKLREEFDHDFDGLADMKSYYEGGQLVRQELDVDFDGKPDLVEYFEGGKRVRLEKLLALPPTVGPSDKVDPPSPGSPSDNAPKPGSGSPSDNAPKPGAVVPSTGTPGAVAPGAVSPDAAPAPGAP